MLFNINDKVRVKLTNRGKEILRKNRESSVAGFKGDLPASFKEFTLPKEDSDGWSEWQMWNLMSDFGEHINIVEEPPFETTIDIIVSNKVAA